MAASKSKATNSKASRGRAVMEMRGGRLDATKAADEAARLAREAADKAKAMADQKAREAEEAKLAASMEEAAAGAAEEAAKALHKVADGGVTAPSAEPAPAPEAKPARPSTDRASIPLKAVPVGQTRAISGVTVRRVSADKWSIDKAKATGLVDATSAYTKARSK